MSDNDLIRRRKADDEYIRRGDVREHIQRYLSDRNKTTTELMGGLYLIPAVPHEMTAREYVIARRRLCNAHLDAVNQCADDFVTRCAGCLIEDYCEGAKDDVDEEIAIIEEWAREHPEERSEE